MSYESDLKHAEELVNIVKFFQNNVKYLDDKGAYISTISVGTDILGLGNEYKYESHDYDLEFKYFEWNSGTFYSIDESGEYLEFSEEEVLFLNSEYAYFQYSTIYPSSALRALVVFNAFLKENFNNSIFIDLNYVYELNQVIYMESRKK
ncbi:hypothetical protein [Escherichia coli]|uniref:hypothetical protein n=1 Tax=Escherichia coli TaxID=562 RepID=UPI0021D1F3CC|nr:hypothetical protein [Escherichia coli]MCU6294400.1 hypothetical protein [Escherichia coli]